MQPTSDVLRRLLPEFTQPVEITSVGGGSISDAFRVRLADSRQYFVKSNDATFVENFQAESDGLVALHQSVHEIGELDVPLPDGVIECDGSSWLAMPWITTVAIHTEFFETFGRGLAKFHRATLRKEYDSSKDEASPGDETPAIGWPTDNFIGATKQINEVERTWAAFFAKHRLAYQIRLAHDHQRCSNSLRQNVDRILDDLDSILAGREASTSLLHGDLWSGNFLASTGDNASDLKTTLIDPAVYRGCREAEFGMLTLFGSCPDSFYQAYQAEFPLPDGCWKRIEVYRLYHLLNHLNLFGRSYLDQCERLAAGIAKAPNRGR